MTQGKSKFLPAISAFVDILLLLSSFILSKYFTFVGVDMPNVIYYNWLIVLWAILWVILCMKFSLYEIPRVIYIHKILSANLCVITVFAFISGALIFFTTDSKFSREFFLKTIMIFTISVVLWRIIQVYLLKKYRQRGFNFRKVVIVGLNENSKDLIKSVYFNPNYGYKISGLFTDEVMSEDFKKYYKGKLSDVHSFLKQDQNDEILIALPYQESALINDLLKFADNNMIRSYVIPEFSEYLSQTFAIQYLNNIPVMKMRREPLQSLTNRMIKRFFDVVFSLGIVLFVFSWLFPILALIIKTTNKGPVFFVQERTGKNGENFQCFKFRSMKVNSESDHLQASKSDTRITPFGAFMRRTSIDELPQIFNVLLNQMSLVGPRPHMIKHTEQYRLLVDKFMVRHFAKPGVTGWAQINGFRGETKEVKDMKNRAEADIWYIENWSFFLDLKIVFSTSFSIFFKKDENAY